MKAPDDRCLAFPLVGPVAAWHIGGVEGDTTNSSYARRKHPVYAWADYSIPLQGLDLFVRRWDSYRGGN